MRYFLSGFGVEREGAGCMNLSIVWHILVVSSLVFIMATQEDIQEVHEVQEAVDGTLEAEETSDCFWPDSTTAKIIEMWRERPQLYDVTHRWYLNRDKKAEALSEIAREIKITGKCNM
jgi:hypothetical protein